MNTLQFEVDNKLSIRLWDMCSLVADMFASPSYPFELVLEHLSGLVLDLLHDRPLDVLMSITDPALGAENFVMRFGIVDSLHIDLTVAAFNSVGHNASLYGLPH